jgi:hypothetical protein
MKIEEINNGCNLVFVAYCNKIMDLNKTNPFKRQNAQACFLY